MTSVILRRVVTALETKARTPGGLSVRDAIARADQALKTLAPAAEARLDAGIVELARRIEPASARPSPASLGAIEDLADALLGYCAALERPGLAECLISLTQLAQAVAQSDRWAPGTFGPSLSIVRLTAVGALAPDQTTVLVEAVERCIRFYQPDFVRFVDEG